MKKAMTHEKNRLRFGYTLLLLWIPLIYAACKKNDKKYNDTALQISAFTPSEAAPGSIVLITGTSFSTTKSENQVAFNGTQAEVLLVNKEGTELTVIAPAQASTGKITVDVAGKAAITESLFTINPNAPQLGSITPMKGNIGEAITIEGQRFGTTVEVYFDTKKATSVERESETKLIVDVPSGATTGRIKVKSGNFEMYSAAAFQVAPRISRIEPLKQIEDGEVLIEGTNFSAVAGETKVYFGLTLATQILEASSTKLRVKVPASAQNTKIRVVVSEMQTSSDANFTLLPSITGITPLSGKRGTVVTITGKNMADNAKVFVEDLEITSFEAGRSSTSISFKVPETAVGGKILIKYAEETFEAGTYKVTGIWKPLGDGRSGHYSDNISFVANNKIYIGFGYGESSNTNQNNKFMSYDPATNTWSTAFTVPAKVPLRNGAAATMHNGKLYVGGGVQYTESGSSYLRDWWEYDPAKTGDDAWRLTNGVSSLYSNGAASANGKLFYMTGGGLYQYEDASGGTLNYKTGYSGLIDHTHGAAQTINNKIYFFGAKYGYTNSKALPVYDPSTSLFTTGKSIPEASSINSCVTLVLNDQLYAVISTNYSDEYKTYRYDPVTNDWTNLNIKFQASGIYGPYNAAVINGKAFIWTYVGIIYEFIP